MSLDPASVPLSLSYYTVPELDPLETVDVAADAGCALVGFRLLHGQPDAPDAPDIMRDAGLRRAVLDRMRARRVAAFEASAARLLPATVMPAFAPFLAVAAELGIRHVMASGDDPDEARLIDRLGWLSDAAAAHGLTVDVEFVPWMSVADVPTAARIVRAVGRPNLGIAVDALHFQRSRSRLADVAALPRPWLRFLQVCDAPGSWSDDRAALLHAATKERLFPGEGAIDLVGLIRAMPSGIPLTLEIPTEALARSMPAVERVRRAVAATRRVLAAARS